MISGTGPPGTGQGQAGDRPRPVPGLSLTCPRRTCPRLGSGMAISRRQFLVESAGAVAALHLGQSQRPDVVIRGGTVFDGISVTPRSADLVITGDRIAAIAATSPQSGVIEIDAR